MLRMLAALEVHLTTYLVIIPKVEFAPFQLAPCAHLFYFRIKIGNT